MLPLGVTSESTNASFLPLLLPGDAAGAAELGEEGSLYGGGGGEGGGLSTNHECVASKRRRGWGTGRGQKVFFRSRLDFVGWSWRGSGLA